MTVYAELKVDLGSGFVTVNSATFSGWTSGTRQIAMAWNATNSNTGRYPFTLEIRNQFATSSYAAAPITGYFLIVNRSFAAYVYPMFGSGWYLAGLEQILGQTDNTMLWVGGDGTIKHYRLAPGYSWGRWIAPPEAYQDTLVWDGTASRYIRTLRHGIKVQYDVHGLHRETIGRTGHQTQFFWDTTSWVLDSIKVPPAGAARRTYRFLYSGGMLDKIIDPAGRVTDATVNASRDLASIVDPEPSLVSAFTYDVFHRMLTRTSPRGFTTRYQYGNGIRLSTVREPYGNKAPADTALTTFVPWDERGLGNGPISSAVDTSLAVTVIRGPRHPSVPDTARFHVDRWGAPTRTVNALGHVTTIVRGDSLVPGLTTRITYPNLRVVRLAWNTRGNLTSQVDSTERGQATTQWEYNSQNTADAPSRVVDPMNRSSYFWYDSLGITETTKDARGHQTRFLRFAATSGTNYKGMLASVTEREVNTWWESDSTNHVQDQVASFTYDSLGNVRTETSALGVTTAYVRDTITRVTDVYNPFGGRQEMAYDRMNRVTTVRQHTTYQIVPFGIQPLASCAANQIVCDDYSQDFGSQLPSILTTTYRPTPAGVDSIADPRGVTRKFGFDARGAARREIDEFGAIRDAFFGAGGQLDSAITRDSLLIRYEYDVLGRRTQMWFPQRASNIPGDAVVVTSPGDTTSNTYDNSGNLLTATNRRGTIRREYYSDGLLKKKVTQIILPWPGFDPDSLEYGYNLAGQLTQRIHNRRDTVDYRYKPNGDLDSLIVRWAGSGSGRTRVFTFEWDSLGRRSRVNYPYSIYVTLSYDAGGTLRALKSVNPYSASSGNDRLDFTFRNRRVDALGRIWQQRIDCWDRHDFGDNLGNPCGNSAVQRDSSTYNRNGMLVGQQRNSVPVDTMQYDASGNLLVKFAHPDAGHSERYSYVVGATSNRLVADSALSASPDRRINHFYTAGGGLIRVAPKDTAIATYAWFRWHYYDALDRLTGTSRLEPFNSWQRRWNLDSCQYDPDGQLARPCDVSGVPWLLFDGNNVYHTLYNSPNIGWVFVHGPALDDPLMARFTNGMGQWRELFYVTDGNGRQFAVADSIGYVSDADFTLDRRDHQYAGGTKNSNTFSPDRFGTPEVPGVSFFRNRAYDSRTGRWTQEDPMGVSGGINLYQFNGNNPVTYTDPFGLCIDPADPDCTTIGRIVASASAWLNSAPGRAAEALSDVAGAVLGAIDNVLPGSTALAEGIAGVSTDGTRLTGGQQAGALAIGVVQVVAGTTAGGRGINSAGRPLGPSGKPMIHQIDKATRKEAKDAARNAGNGAPMHHPSPRRGEPHYHPTDGGRKVEDGTHYNYPP